MTPAPKNSPEHTRSCCPITSTLDLIGDKWTLLIVRDMIYAGATRYSQFAKSPESIPTNILADRLRRLEAAGLIRSQQYTDKPPRSEYHLTESGAALYPVLMAMVDWGNQHVAGTRKIPPKSIKQVEDRLRETFPKLKL